MSGADERSAIESKFAEAKETARAYLQAVGVLDPDGLAWNKRRERDIRLMADAILGTLKVARKLPNDPGARDAVMRARLYLHHGYHPEILDDLRERDRTPPISAGCAPAASGAAARRAKRPSWRRSRPVPRGARAS